MIKGMLWIIAIIIILIIYKIFNRKKSFKDKP
jgi:hypothetical protein